MKAVFPTLKRIIMEATQPFMKEMEVAAQNATQGNAGETGKEGDKLSLAF